MSYEFFRKLPTPLEIKTMYPVSDEVAKQKELNDTEIRKVFTGELDKFLLIIGPTFQDLLKFRKKLKINFLSFQEFTQTNLVQQVRDIKVCYISLILKRNLICFKG